MTILLRLEKPGFDLTVCGTPNAEWLGWVRTTEVPLTAGQRGWREVNMAKNGNDDSRNDRDREAEQERPRGEPTEGVRGIQAAQRRGRRTRTEVVSTGQVCR